MPTTEIDICNAALSKNHVLDDLSSTDGTVANITSTGVASSLCKKFFAGARQQILRLASWTCVQKRMRLANRASARSTAYVVGDLVVELHGTTPAIYKCTVAGTTGASAPTFPVSGTVSDGTVTWTFVSNLLAGILQDNLSGYEDAFPLPADYINQIDVADASGRKVDFALEGFYLYCDLAIPVFIYVPDSANPDTWDPLLKESITTQLASMLAYPLTGSHENEVAFGQIALKIVDQAIRKTNREKRQGPMVPEEWMPGLFENAQKANQA